MLADTPGTPRRHVCTKDEPWNESKGSRAVQPNATLTDYDGDSEDEYHCPNCNLTFRVQLPDY